MGDAPQGLVQVQQGRLSDKEKKRLKAVIAKCDREIQLLSLQIDRCNNCISYGFGAVQYRKSLKAATQKRSKLDAKRKETRLKLKGYK